MKKYNRFWENEKNIENCGGSFQIHQNVFPRSCSLITQNNAAIHLCCIPNTAFFVIPFGILGRTIPIGEIHLISRRIRSPESAVWPIDLMAWMGSHSADDLHKKTLSSLSDRRRRWSVVKSEFFWESVSGSNTCLRMASLKNCVSLANRIQSDLQ